MESSRLRLLPLLGAALLLLLPLLGAGAQEDAELQPRALDIYSAVDDASHEKELVSISLASGSPLGYHRVLALRASLSIPVPSQRADPDARFKKKDPGYPLPDKDI